MRDNQPIPVSICRTPAERLSLELGIMAERSDFRARLALSMALSENRHDQRASWIESARQKIVEADAYRRLIEINQEG